MAVHKLYVKVTHPNGDMSIYSCMDIMRKPSKTLAHLQKKANKRVPGAKYELSNKEDYEAFWAKVNEANRQAAATRAAAAAKVNEIAEAKTEDQQ